MSESYQTQLENKKQLFTEKLAPFYTSSIDVFASPEQHYRMRAEFRVWHDGDDLYYVMFHPGTRDKYRVDQFPAAGELINSLMPEILDYVKNREILRNRLFQVDFLTTTSNQAVISLLYHRQLDETWQNEVLGLKGHLSQFCAVNIIGRARKQKICLDTDAVIEKLSVAGKDYLFEQVENSFTQPNAAINVKMLEWAQRETSGLEGDLLELYCGNGNFSLPLASNFKRVLGTEISRTSVKSAQTNIALNKIENVKIARMSAEDFALAIAGKLDSRRADDLELETYDFSTVLVDPPRAGLDSDALEQIQPYQHIIYISCNPETLVENLSKLCQTHHVVAAALFDQFPFTHHMESGVHLVRKD
ncbi:MULTISPECIES: tRNA (uridine(54)-C5)-methyltransferase TrmA [Gammaproteobacteria]|uniref:tRNA (uridine(54)-C5)-methyltransferase TrmA n=1 Tax=Gammaproteobacteria TaxID=1236 RepID=UPI000DD03A39|nr:MULTISPECIES: tRNA (uridine(54)-C5)-methyltransferase TrmA [Gammaproteobacteria]RTE85677.1 tRNA (uridine(54)-C5)-methyltransferase TrmA [Aliidiomarina sp. B3213]TCZ90320.1 tRNA (uridine(54)-C5)-methyltransferase TrmA [Lysobacter sp. N42]